MTKVQYIAPTCIAGTDIEYAQGVRAGSWLFFTGHTATDFEHGLVAPVAGRRDCRVALRLATGEKATSFLPAWRNSSGSKEVTCATLPGSTNTTRTPRS